MCLTHNEENSAVAERFIYQNFEKKIYKHMTTLLKNVYMDQLDEIVDKYNKTCHGTIKMKPADAQLDTYIGYGVEHNDKNPNFRVDDRVKISKCQNFFAKCYPPNWCEEVFAIKKVKNTLP